MISSALRIDFLNHLSRFVGIVSAGYGWLSIFDSCFACSYFIIESFSASSLFNCFFSGLCEVH